MTTEELPAYFFPAFFTAFGVNAAYLVTLFALGARVNSVSRRTGEASPFRLFGGSMGETFKMLRFVFGGGHVAMNDQVTTVLTRLVRLLFVAAFIGTAGVFLMFVRLG